MPHRHARSPMRPVAAVAAALMLCALAAAAAAVPASADRPQASAARHAPGYYHRGSRGPVVRAIQRRLGLPADGVFGARTKRKVKRFQRRAGLTIDGVAGPITLRALGIRRSAPPRRGLRLPAVLRRIARCESGGNPRAVSRDGRYRGKYQFSIATWRGLGGRGDPARASERLQDRMALRLYRRAGTRPWAGCMR